LSAGAEGGGVGPPYDQPGSDQSLGDLFGNLTSDLSELVRSEMELARVEIREEAAKAGRAAGLLGAGGLIAYLGLGLMAMAAAWGLAEVVDAGWAFLIVGVVIATIGAVLVMKGRDQLGDVQPVPEETVETLKEDAQWARARVK
jgi:uncharacterized membrane protein YqjE